MIVVGTIIKVIDNTGANRVKCIRLYRKKLLAQLEDVVLVTIKKCENLSKQIKRGMILKALIVRSKLYRSEFSGAHFIKCDTNAVILMKSNGDFVGNRINSAVCNDYSVR